MNDIYSVLTGLAMHAYKIGAFIVLISIPAHMLFRALRGHTPI